MGCNISHLQQKHVRELKFLLHKSGMAMPDKELTKLMSEIGKNCPWYPERGTLQLKDWERIGNTLHQEPRASVDVLQCWHQCRYAVEKYGADAVQLSSTPSPGFDHEKVSVPSAPISSTMDVTPSEQKNSRSYVSICHVLENQMAKGEGDMQEIADMLSVCPVPLTGQVDLNGAPVVEYRPLSYAILTELRKDIRDTGLNSSYVQGMLEATMRNHVLVPEDWKTTICMLLTPAQYVVWDSEFRQQCALRAATSGGAYLPEQLYGSGDYTPVDAQIVLPIATLQISSECAFGKVPITGKPSQAFSNICQKANEPYADFINCLQDALKRHIDNPDAQAELLIKLAKENATQNIMLGLGMVRKIGDG